MNVKIHIRILKPRIVPEFIMGLDNVSTSGFVHQKSLLEHGLLETVLRSVLQLQAFAEHKVDLLHHTGLVVRASDFPLKNPGARSPV